MSIIQEDMEYIHSVRTDWNIFKNKKVLITGGYGMLASYIVFFFSYLNENQGMNVHIYCQGNTPAKMHKRFGSICNKDYFHECYFLLTEPISLEEKMDFIIHAASLANPSYYENSPIEVEEPNAIGTYFLLRYAQKVGVESFLFFSTGDVYGKVENCESITENIYGITDPLAIHSCYGESKRMGETWCASFAREHGVPVKIARLSHTYGPTMDLEHDPRVFASFVNNIVRGEDITILSDGSAKRCFCYISDATIAFFLILLDGKNGEAYNIVNSSQFVSIRELAENLVNCRPEKNLKVVFKTRNKNENYLEAKFNKANKMVEDKLKALGWICKYDIQEGFSRVISHYEEV